MDTRSRLGPNADSADSSGSYPQQAAAVVWERMREFAKEEGGLRALDLFRQFDHGRVGCLEALDFQAALEKVTKN
jgi:hypothetical protein